MPGVARVGVDTVGGGIITSSPQNKLTVNGSLAAAVGSQIAPHGSGPHANATITQGSPTLNSDGIAIARIGDVASCGHTVQSGSSDVIAN